MVRQWKEMGLTTQQGGGGSYGEELGSFVFVLFGAIVTFSLLAGIMFMCADGISKDSTRASTANNYGNGTTCGGGCGAGCGGGCGG